MAEYAIGDLQGCFDELQALLEQLDFDSRADRLWFCGDLVNRGPRSLQTLRWVRGLGEYAVVVLGNHDLHLLAVAANARKMKDSDTFSPILQANDARELLDWLRRRPLIHRDPALGWTMVHAGVPPQWTLAEALSRAGEVQAKLRGDDWRRFLRQMYGNESRWQAGQKGPRRLRYIVNALTRMRYVNRAGDLDLDYKGPPETAPAGLLPWFTAPARATRGERLVFGHWSTLGTVAWETEQVYGLDTGCTWGGSLTALRLDSDPPQITSLDCEGYNKPSQSK